MCKLKNSSCDNVSLATITQPKNNGTAAHANTSMNANSSPSVHQKQHSNSPEMGDEPRERDPNATLTRKSSNASMHMKPLNWQNNMSGGKIFFWKTKRNVIA